MSDGHGDGGGCGTDGHAPCAAPVPGNGEAGYVAAAPDAKAPVVNGIEINRAAIIELAKRRMAVPPR